MAPFRKSSSKTRAALEASTALPPEPEAMMTHVGEQAAQLADAAIYAAPSAEGASAKGSRRTRATVAPVTDASLSEPFEASVPEVAATQELTNLSVAATWEAASPDARSAIEEISESARDAVETSTTAAAEPMQSVVDEPATQLEAASDEAASLRPAAIEPVAAVATFVDAVVGSAIEAAAPLVDQASTLGSQEHPASTMREFNIKLADVVRDHVEESLSFFAALANVRSVPDVFTLNSQHLQRRMEAFTLQSRDLTILAGKLAAHALTPFTPTSLR